MFSLCGVNVHVLPGGPIETNAYLLTEASTGEAILIDAPEGTWDRIEPILKRDGCRLTELWLTHGHWDHTQGAAEVVRKSRAPVVAHLGDKPLIETPEVMRPLMIPGLEVEPVKVDRWLDDGAVMEALGRQVSVRHVPGHSEGSLMFYFPAASAAFSGDALFRANVGRTDLPGGDPDVLSSSIRTKIYTLPDKTKVFPGHGGATTVGDEKTGNPYVRA
ncbi:MAG TPA: MBL fold metallo-hydrolase [Opitutaceae bacterium]|jgi:glyoxylase-like metal-dependent hydrolase (beta-lactamase superfamily II)|nr:MBL fold metallo-hydrolase [Opitutaceae bacterium]